MDRTGLRRALLAGGWIWMALARSAFGGEVDSCLDAAAGLWRIPPLLMRAVARHESGKNPAALRVNRNGSVDIGLMQINSVHLPELARLGVTAAGLRDPCVNAVVGGWLLKQQIARFGLSARALGAYHAPNAPRRWPGYAGSIAQALAKELIDRERVQAPVAGG